MGRGSVTVWLARRLQALPLRFFQFVEWPFLRMFVRRYQPVKALFILALPRSGSTVTYQSICHGLSVQYLSNLWSLFYQLPLLGGFLSAFLAKRYRSDFKSHHGFVEGLNGPAEGLRFWKWWLGCGLIDDECDRKYMRRARYLSSVLGVLARLGGAFVTAYLGHVLVPDRIKEAFTGAALVRLRRDPVSNGLSLLKSMRASQSVWFSVLPEECKGLENASEHERVAAQVYWLNRRLDDAVCSNDMLTVHYEDFCENPHKELERIRNWLLEKGFQVEVKLPLPECFDYKIADCENDPDAIKIQQALTRLEKAYGKLKRNS